MSEEQILQNIRNAIASYSDFPKKGVIFRDVLPILEDPKLCDDMLTIFQDYLKVNVPNLQCIAGIDSRGCWIGLALALKMKLGFYPVRKAGKLPGDVLKESYSLEYGSDSLEVKKDSIKAGQKFVIVDDLIATGGSMEAAVKLIKRAGGDVEHCLTILELKELNGREKVPAPVHSLFQY